MRYVVCNRLLAWNQFAESSIAAPGRDTTSLILDVQRAILFVDRSVGQPRGAIRGTAEFEQREVMLTEETVNWPVKVYFGQ